MISNEGPTLSYEIDTTHCSRRDCRERSTALIIVRRPGQPQQVYTYCEPHAEEKRREMDEEIRTGINPRAHEARVI